MPCPDAPSAQRHICVDQMRAWPHDLGQTDLVAQASEPVRSPAGKPGPVLKLSHRDKREDSPPTFTKRPVSCGQ
jgi:hypothetical protein